MDYDSSVSILIFATHVIQSAWLSIWSSLSEISRFYFLHRKCSFTASDLKLGKQEPHLIKLMQNFFFEIHSHSILI